MCQFWLAFLLALASMPTSGIAQDRGVIARPTQPQGAWTPARRIVVTIGIDKYKSLPELNNAVSDALAVQALLRTAGFEVVVPALVDGKATKAEILKLLMDDLPSKLRADDDLVIFFAGHGASRVATVGNRSVGIGYLVPADAARDRWSDYLPIVTLLESIGALPARHILLVLDSCRAGVALGRAVDASEGSMNGSVAARVSRMVITSADVEQDAADSGPVEGHSLFTGFLIRGLTGGADPDKIGAITDDELFTYLKSNVRRASGSKQSPAHGAFLADDRGEITLPLVQADTLANLSKLASLEYPSPVSLAPNRGIILDPPLNEVTETPAPLAKAREAVVVVSDRYKTGASLVNAQANAKQVADSLKALGYDVTFAVNPNKLELMSTLQGVAHKTPRLGSVVFFYSGYGFAKGQTKHYLALQDFDPKHPARSTVALPQLGKALASRRAGEQAFFLDMVPVGETETAAQAAASASLAKGSWTLMGRELAGRLAEALHGKAASADGIISFQSIADSLGATSQPADAKRATKLAMASRNFPIGVVEPPAPK